MRRTKRVSIEFRHREITITLESPAKHVQRPGPEAANDGSVCPVCGSSWITLVSAADEVVLADADRIDRALQQAGVHFQLSPAGRLQICQKSFEEFKEMF